MKEYIYLEPLFYEEDFENFKSDMCHFLKRLGDRDFMFLAISEKWVPIFWEANMNVKAFYTLALLDYLAHLHGLQPFPGYECYRSLTLSAIVYPRDVLAESIVSANDKLAEVVEIAKKDPVGKYFIKYNIIEMDIRNVS